MFFYISDSSGTDRKTLAKEDKIVGIDEISIFQVLEQKPSENTHYRWPLSEDCTVLSQNKLFLSKFASDISWLIVTSVQKQTVFDVRSIEKKIVYQILDPNLSSSSNAFHINSVNFRTDDGLTFSNVFTFVPVDDNRIPPVEEANAEEEPEVLNLRRSKRRYVQPERYLGVIGLEPTDTTALRIGYKFWNQEYLALVIVNEDNTSPVLEGLPQQSYAGAIEYPGENHPFLNIASQAKDDNLLINDGGVLKEKRKKRKYVKRDKASKGKTVQSKGKAVQKPKNRKGKLIQRQKEGRHNELVILSLKDDRHWMPREQRDLPDEIHPKPLDINVDEVPLKFYTRRYTRRSSTITATDRMRISELDDIDGEPIFGANKRIFRKYQRTKNRRVFSTSRSDESFQDPSRNKKPLDVAVYKDLISTYMKNIQLTIENKELVGTDAWKDLQGASSMYEKKAAEKEGRTPEEEDDSETETLFREMDLCLASSFYEPEVTNISYDVFFHLVVFVC